MKNSFIPCSKWIKRGVAKAKPDVVHLSKGELKGLVDKAKSEILGTAEIIRQTDQNENGSQSTSDQFGMEDYDKDDDVQDLIDIGGMISFDDDGENLDSQSDKEDVEDENDSDKEDDEIKPNDNLIAVANVYDDMSILEVYVFNEEDNDLYVHHDILLPTIPLALEWLSFVPNQATPGNLLAIGGISREITIWDLDVVNSLEPLLKLGQFSRKKKFQHRNYGHRDAVLDLSWNTKLSHVLASASVDQSVLLWDLGKGKAVTQFNEFYEKVQTIEWHPSEVNLLVAGSCDSSVKLLDGRIAKTLMSLNVVGEVEKVAWHPTNPYSALVGTNIGTLCCADCRSGKLIWQIKAHNNDVTGLGVDSARPETIVTCSMDQTLKVWSLTDGEPVLKYSKQTNLGGLQCVQLCPENPDIVCVGGSNKSSNFKVINLSTEIQEAEAQNMDTGPFSVT